VVTDHQVHLGGGAAASRLPAGRRANVACIPPAVDLDLPDQLLAHQDVAQVTRAKAACPLGLGWKKSRVLTWLALNW
jgi:hypothetical protein